MSITLRGVIFLKDSHPQHTVGKRVVVTAVIDPDGSVLAAVDDGKGAAVTASTPLLSVTYYLDDGTAVPTGTIPGSVSVTYGYVQEQYAVDGERTIRCELADYSTGAILHDGNAYVHTFEPYGTVFTAPIEVVVPADTGVPGTGLLGRWFANRELTGQPTAETVGPLYLRGKEAGVSVYPGGQPPAAIPSDAAYSVRWTGAIKIPTTGQYRFRLEVDDGFRLYLDGRLALDFWRDNNRTHRLTGYYDYVADQQVTIWVEQYNKGSNDYGWMDFQWEAAGAQFAPVPLTVLYSTDGTDALPPAQPAGPQLRFFCEVVNRYEE